MNLTHPIYESAIPSPNNPYLVYPHSPAPAHPATPCGSSSSSYYRDPYYAAPAPVQLAPAPPSTSKIKRIKSVAKITSYTVTGNRVNQNSGDNHRIFNIGDRTT